MTKQKPAVASPATCDGFYRRVDGNLNFMCLEKRASSITDDDRGQLRQRSIKVIFGHKKEREVWTKNFSKQTTSQQHYCQD